MISIIIPVFNGSEWLSEAIESALHQITSWEYEVIVVDDGSTDNSLEIAESYKDKQKACGYKVISQVNKGLASARNTGIMNSTGYPSDWVLFLDADDVLKKNCLERINQTFPHDKSIIGLSFKEFGLSDREVILMEKPTLEDFKTGNRLGYCQAIRKDALLAVGGYSSKMVEGYEDLHLTVNLLTKGFKITTIPAILWLYRTKQESMYTKITPEIHKKLIGQINKDFNVGLEF